MASASARIVAMNVFSITSGLSTPAPAMAGPEMPIPKPAPIADRRTLSPAPRLAQNVGQVESPDSEIGESVASCTNERLHDMEASFPISHQTQWYKDQDQNEWIGE